MADHRTPSQGLDSTEPPPPEILAGRYVLEREIGRGATATVYLARDPKYDRRVAVKVLSRELAYAVGPKRFLREIEITAQLQHPNILAIYDSGESDGLLYYVTPFLEGDSLRARLTKERQLPVDVAVRITTELADALQYAHERSIVHRDIKPENILFSGGHACLADFGIAQAIQHAGGARLTTTGLVLGTPAYMSPEQAAGDRDLDGRSDLYSLACVLYEMLAGMAPFIGPTPESVVAQRFSHTPRPIRAFRAGVPANVERALARAFSLAPADRFVDLRSFAESLTTVTPEPEAPAAAKPAGARWTWQWALAGVATVIALGTAAMTLTHWGVGASTVVPSRVAVMPFAGGGGKQLTDEMARRETYDALRRWRDLDLVDLGTVGQVTQRPLSDKAAAAIGRQLGAGQLVQGTASSVGDSVHIDMGLYDLTAGRRTRGLSVVVPDVRTTAADGYRRAVAALLRERDFASGFDVGDGGTNSLAAWRAYQRGAVALERWDLSQAEREFASAVGVDASYAVAQLWLAQVGSWLRDNRPETWQDAASRAVVGEASLGERDRLLAQGVFALSKKQFATACKAYDALLTRDSLDVVAWFGRGECLSKDPTVVRDPRSPSGWRFSTSRQAGISAFLHALELAPDAHPAFALDRRERLLFLSTNRVRVGYTVARDSFAAFPSYDRAGDSLAFIPVPAGMFLTGELRAMPLTLDLAVQRQRDILLRLARDWVRRNPQSPTANESLAHALELRGDLGTTTNAGGSALDALRVARAVSTDRDQQLRLAMAQVRLFVKRGEFDAARVLADSLLTPTETDPHRASALAGVAALTGRAALTASLLARASSESGGSNESVDPHLPEQVRTDATMLSAYAALGVCDSVPGQVARVEKAIDTYVEPNGRLTASNQILPRALSMAAPCDSGRALLQVSAADRLIQMQRALAQRDYSTLRRHFRLLDETRRSDRPGDVAIDYTFQEAWLLTAIGDSAAAAIRLDRALDALPTLGDYIIERVDQAAALGRALRLRQSIGNHTPGAERAGNRLTSLWREADADVRGRQAR